RVHLAIEHHHPDVARGRSGERSALHLLHHAFQDTRHELVVDHAAHDAVVEHQFAAGGELMLLLAPHAHATRLGHALGPWLDPQVHLGELSAAARLLLVAVARLSVAADGLAVGD